MRATPYEWFVCSTHPSYYNHIVVQEALHWAYAHGIHGCAESCAYCGGYHIFWDKKPLNQRRIFWFSVSAAMYCVMMLAAWVCKGDFGFVLSVLGGFAALFIAVLWQCGRPQS
jgi:hypothetical protein